MRYFRPVFLFLFLASSAALSVSAQPAAVRGFVTDAANGEPLLGANVALQAADGQLFGEATDADGFFAIGRLAAGRYVVRVSFIGYATHRDTLTLDAGELRAYDVALQAGEEELDEVEVQAPGLGGAARQTAGLQTIQPADIDVVPGPDVTGDLANFLTTLPGVVTLGDQGGQFFIRGGEPWQNLVLLDGMLVYQPFHLLGFFSAFPSDILNSVDIYAGGYGARYGGRLSSVIDVTTRRGNNQRYQGAATLSPFLMGVRAEGPVDSGGRISFLSSFRQSVIEAGAAHLVDHPVPYNFNDLFGKVHAVVRRNGRLSITGLRTYDRGKVGEDVGLTPLAEVRYRNEAVGARYLYLPGTLPVLGEFMISLSRLNMELGPDDAPIRTSTTARMNTSANLTHYGGLVDVQWGLFARTLELDSELSGLYQNVSLAHEFLTEVGIYLGTEFKLGEDWRITPSLRVHSFPSKFDTYVEPRVRAVWQRGRHQWSAAVGTYHQEIVSINDRRDATSVFTAWTAVPEFGPAGIPFAFHALLGYHVQPTAWLDWSIEGYYKNLENLFIAEWTAFPRLTTNLQPADGRVLGLDTRLEVRFPRFYGYVNYGLASVEYRAQQASLPIWFGTERFAFRPAHDRRHQVNALGSTRLLGIDLSVRWQFGSGLPFNRALGFDSFILMNGAVNVYQNEGSRRVIYERPYNGILPTYHRLDVSAEHTFQLPGADLTLQASVLNLYDRRNLFYLDVFTLRRADQLPFIPSFGIRLASR